MIILKGENIHKRYGTLEVLRGVDINVREGSVVVIEGPSGAGKSTLLNILATLDKPTTGRVIWKEKFELTAERGKNLARFRNLHMGFVFQFHYLLPELTAIENVMVPALIAGLSKTEAYRKARNLLEVVGLADRLKHYPDQLSGGEQQRVAIARALVNSPEIIFADEPTGNLDMKQGEKIRDMFKQINDEFGTTFVIVTHNPMFRKIATERFVLQDGKLYKVDSEHAGGMDQ